MKEGSLQQNIVYLCSGFTHRFSQAVTAEFRVHKIPVTVEQFAILALLWFKDGINQQEISNSLEKDKTTTTRVIANMKKNKLISRKTNKVDNRSKLIFLTEKGKAIQFNAVQVSGALYMKALKGIPAKQLDSGVELIQKMINNLNH